MKRILKLISQVAICATFIALLARHIVIADGGVVTLNITDSVVVSAPWRVGPQVGLEGPSGNGQLRKNWACVNNCGFELTTIRQNAVLQTAGTTTTFPLSNASPSAVITQDMWAGATFSIDETSVAANKGCTGAIVGNTTGGSGAVPVLTVGSPITCPSTGATVLSALPAATANHDWINYHKTFNQIDGFQVITTGGTTSVDTTTQLEGQSSLVVDTTNATGSTYVRNFNNSLPNNTWRLPAGTYVISLRLQLRGGTGTGIGTLKWADNSGTQCSLTTGTVTSSNAIYSTTCVLNEAASFSVAGTNQPNTGTMSWIQNPGHIVAMDSWRFERTDSQDSTNSTILSDEYIAGMKQTCGTVNWTEATPLCTYRYWGQNQGDDYLNMMKPYETADQSQAGDAGYVTHMPVPDYLQASYVMHATPQYTMPIGTSNADALKLVEYLARSDISGGEGARRAAHCTNETAIRAQLVICNGKPWVRPTGGDINTGAFSQVNITLAVEPWNSGFRLQNAPKHGGTPTVESDYAQRAGTLYAIMRQSPYWSNNIKLGYAVQTLNPLVDVATEVGQLQARGGQPDYVEISGYTGGNVVSNTPIGELFLAGIREAWLSTHDPATYNPTYNAVAAIKAILKCGPTGDVSCIPVVYEESNGVLSVNTGMTNAQAAQDATNRGFYQALVTASEVVNNTLYGIRWQHWFASTGYGSSPTAGKLTTKLYSTFVDCGGAMSKTNNTPCVQTTTGLALQLFNASIIGDATTCTATNNLLENWAGDTTNGPSKPYNGLPDLDVWCTKDASGNRGVLIVNRNPTADYTFAMSGPGAAVGSITQSQIQSDDLTAMNEAASNTWTNSLVTPINVVTATVSVASSPHQSVTLLNFNSTVVAPTRYYLGNRGAM